ncbi:hypothetical protein ES711_08650 [Gelidibacter salicanalis]|uniref:Type I restriction modification DNA specificity domain-containing protein n=1 Tax=Gelidibacter salicanalis TaxID=291193 RepID=A0A5C7AJF7_9FLAO|nr:restriction endonuclease subunit S [Gelidibacter salicanalis]TXE08561.1 hypothetical protein ES711_08650 [Gelidibacter salicanalis]
MNKSNLLQNLNNLKLLPSSWAVKNFSDVVADNSGGNKKLAKSNFLDEGDIAIVDQGKDLIAGYYSDPDFMVKAKPPYVVFGDHTRAFKYIDFPFIMGADGTKILQPKKSNCNSKFLYYFFLSINVPNAGYSRHFKYLKTLKIPLPPLETQKKITRILDEADKLQQLDKQLIENYDALTQSLFLDMFGDPATNSMGWRLSTIEKILETKSQNGHYAPRQDYIRDGIQMIHMSDAFYQIVKPGNLKRVKADERLILKYEIKSKDLILSRRSLNYEGAAQPCLVPEYDEPLIYESSLIRLRPDLDIINTTFLFYFLNNQRARQRYVLKHVTRSTISGINNKGLNAIELLVPPINLQNQFAERIQAITAQKKQLQQSLVKSEELFNSLLQKAFKGELIK